jgi:hypothetical protein
MQEGHADSPTGDESPPEDPARKEDEIEVALDEYSDRRTEAFSEVVAGRNVTLPASVFTHLPVRVVTR